MVASAVRVVSALIDAALAKDPTHRFPDAGVMMQALDDAFLSLDNVV